MTDTAAKPSAYDDWDYMRRVVRRLKASAAVVVVAVLNLFFWHGVIGFAISFAVGLTSGWIVAAGHRDKKRTVAALTPTETPPLVNPALLDANSRPVFLPSWDTETTAPTCTKCGGEFLPEGPQPETTVCYWCWLLAVHVHGGQPKKSDVDAMWERLGHQDPKRAQWREEMDRMYYESLRGRSGIRMGPVRNAEYYDNELRWRRF